MFKIFNFAYRIGRKQAYSEIIAKLERLSVSLPHNREGQQLRQPIDGTIAELQASLAAEGTV